MDDVTLDSNEASPRAAPPPEAFDAGRAAQNDSEEEDLEGNGNSLPNPEHIMTDAQTSSADGGNCWTTVGFFLLLALMTATIVGLSVGLTAGNRQEKKNDSYVGKPSGGWEKRQAQLTAYFTENGVNVPQDFDDERGAQSKAILFLAKEDQRRLAIPKGGLNTDEGYALLTRYVMTIIYYANNGKSWDYEMLFLSNHDTCEWFELFPGSFGQVGVICNERTRVIVGLSFSE
jgi:hypothetical protein